MSEKYFRSPVRLFLVSLFLFFSAIEAHATDLSIPDLIDVDVAWANGDYVRAEQKLREALNEALTPRESVRVTANLGILLFMKGRYDEAEVMLKRATVLARSNPSVDPRALPIVLGNLGVLYQRTSRLQEAEAALNEALRTGAKILANRPDHLADL